MRALIVAVLFLLPASACDSGNYLGETGSFELSAPALSTSIKGRASFRAQSGLEFAVFLDGSSGSVVLVSPTEGVPRRGTYAVEMDRRTMDARSYRIEFSPSGGGFYRSESGSVTIKKSSERRVEGRFEFVARSFNEGAGGEAITISGKFEAVPYVRPLIGYDLAAVER